MESGVHSIAVALWRGDVQDTLYRGDARILAPPAVVSFLVPSDGAVRGRAGGGGGGGSEQMDEQGKDRTEEDSDVGVGPAGSDQETEVGKTGVGGNAGGGVEDTLLDKALAEYAEVHARSRQSRRWCMGTHGDEERWRQGECLRALVYTCPRQLGGETAPQVNFAGCGGLADRLKGILSLMELALVTKRSLFIDMKMPLPLEVVLRPYGIDWRMEGVALLEPPVDTPTPDLNWISGGGKGGLFSDWYLMAPTPQGTQAIFSFVADLLSPPEDQIESRNSEQNVTSPFSAAGEATHTARGQPAVRVMCNLALHSVFVHYAPFAKRARDLGLMHAFPTPSHRLFHFLFRLHPDFEDFAIRQISARAQSDPMLLHWLPFIFSISGGDGGGGGGGGQGEAEAREGMEISVFTVQLRFGGHAGYRQQWDDPLITQPWQMQVAADCLRQAIDELLPPHQRNFGPELAAANAPWRVLVVGDHLKVRGDFIRLASQQLQIPPEVFVDLAPDAVVHLDRDHPAAIIASAGMQWCMLEFLLMSRSHSVIVTSGFGAAAGDIGALTPGRVRSVRTELHCAAHPPTPWFWPPGKP